jgi:predicted RNA binding protein YcfA (HicA-like mRNA interferase family)
MKARQLLQILKREPLKYQILRQTGSHAKLRSPNGHKDLTFSFHDSQTIPPGLVKKILTNDVGLSIQEALELLKR